jgi:UDP:flavonoid glycosyltransferase YjiC (YdhE family)
MSTFLVYTPPAAGHVFPLVPGLRELVARGHTVHVRTAPDLLDVLRGQGLAATPIAAEVLAIEVEDWTAEGGNQQLREGLTGLMRRGPAELADLEAAIETVRPDVLLVDVNTYGAAVAAEASGLPWGKTLPSLLPWPGPGIPPYGLGLAPARGPLGRLRDRLLWPAVLRAFGKAMLEPLNQLRALRDLAPYRATLDSVVQADRLLLLTGEPLEYPRAELPPGTRMVGAQLWDPPAPTPGWLTAAGDPWVLVTCSTDYQGDEVLARTAVEALADLPVRVALTLGDAYDKVQLDVDPDRVRVERFLPHSAVIAHAAAVVCHGGMGIVTKAVAAGVPVVAVPFGRDQPEVARRVVEAGAGVQVPARKLDAARLRAAVTTALASGPQVRARAAAIDPAANAARFADAAAELLTVAGRPAQPAQSAQ